MKFGHLEGVPHGPGLSGTDTITMITHRLRLSWDDPPSRSSQTLWLVNQPPPNVPPRNNARYFSGLWTPLVSLKKAGYKTLISWWGGYVALGGVGWIAMKTSNSSRQVLWAVIIVAIPTTMRPSKWPVPSCLSAAKKRCGGGGVWWGSSVKIMLNKNWRKIGDDFWVGHVLTKVGSI